MSDRTGRRRRPVSGLPATGKQRRIMTPEGVDLAMQLGERGERFAAVMIDYLIIHGVTVGILLLWFAGGFSGGPWVASAILLLSFLLRNFYFMFLELRWDGRTIGKRTMGLRVIDARGGPLRADAVIVRNLTREVELHIPLAVLVSGLTGAGWSMVIAIGWAVMFMLLPLFNRNNLRVGDMIAGTWVIAEPKPALLPDLAVSDRIGGPDAGTGLTGGPDRGARRATGLTFTAAQLDMYGIYELQVLEDVLRRRGDQADAARRVVADRIKAKIAWDDTAAPPHTPERFLTAYYLELRRHLETEMLFGRRRARKRPGRLTDPGAGRGPESGQASVPAGGGASRLPDHSNRAARVSVGGPSRSMRRRS